MHNREPQYLMQKVKAAEAALSMINCFGCHETGRSKKWGDAEAVKFAQSVIRDPVKKKAYAKKVKAGQAVYHYALQQYLKKSGK